MTKRSLLSRGNRFQPVSVLFVILIVAVVGTLLLIGSHASTPYASINADTGTRTGGATIQTDGSASDGQYVQFGSSGSGTGRYWGVQIHSTPPTVTAAELTQDLDAAQALGANVVRVPFDWRSIEYSAKGQYALANLAGIDAAVSGATARGMKVIATIATTPTWASTGGLWNDAPTKASDYGDFAQFIANRYGTQLAAIEVWNEPEINSNLIPVSGTTLAAEYTSLVKAAYQGVKAGNPNVAVLAGALSYADTTFLSALYADGIKGSYDGISLHPYADGADPANLTVTHSFEGGIESMHTFQQSAGDNTPEWVTEFGWPTGTSSGASSLTQQAAYLPKAFNIMYGLSYVRGGTLYQLRDQATDPTNPEDNFGLLQQDYTQRPAYGTTQAVLKLAPH